MRDILVTRMVLFSEVCVQVRSPVKMEKKRVRGSNFTRQEELLLLESIEKYASIIECKMTDKTSNFEKVRIKKDR